MLKAKRLAVAGIFLATLWSGSAMAGGGRRCCEPRRCEPTYTYSPRPRYVDYDVPTTTYWRRTTYIEREITIRTSISISSSYSDTGWYRVGYRD